MITDKLESAYVRVQNAKAELAAAEQAFLLAAKESIATNGLPKRGPGRSAKVKGLQLGQPAALQPRSATTRTASPSQDEPTVASIVEKLLSDPSKKYLFADIIEAAGGREKRFAVKSKLNKMRKDKRAKFSNGYYQGTGKD